MSKIGEALSRFISRQIEANYDDVVAYIKGCELIGHPEQQDESPDDRFIEQRIRISLGHSALQETEDNDTQTNQPDA